MKNRSQSILEYTVILSIAVIVLSAMSLYFRRGIQSVIKVAADEFGDQKEAEEVDPLQGIASTSSNIKRKSHTTQSIKVAAGNERTSNFNKTSTASGVSTSVSTQVSTLEN